MRPLLSSLFLAALAASAVTMTVAAAADGRALSAAAAAAVPALAVLAALAMDAPMDAGSAGVAFRRATRLAAAFYAWGSAAFLMVYGLSGLYWQHGWQYGLAMALAAAGFVFYAGRAAGDAKLPPGAFWLTVLHGGAVAGGLIFLLASGKLWRDKPDWAANQIFLAGGVALLAVSLVSAVRLVRGPARRDGSRG